MWWIIVAVTVFLFAKVKAQKSPVVTGTQMTPMGDTSKSPTAQPAPWTPAPEVGIKIFEGDQSKVGDAGKYNPQESPFILTYPSACSGPGCIYERVAAPEIGYGAFGGGGAFDPTGSGAGKLGAGGTDATPPLIE
jgi:hypothetical protein